MGFYTPTDVALDRFINNGNTMTQNELKQAVAQAAIDLILPKLSSDAVVGIGTGSTANYFIDLLAQHKNKFSATIASSNASTVRLQKHGIEVLNLNDVTSIEFYIDGTDETTPQLELIKGGGAALTQEKIVAAVTKTFICIADGSKWVKQLGAFPLPVEVIPMAQAYVSRELVKLGGRPVYRENLVTDNGGHILDVHDLNISNPQTLEQTINHITGVITNGLFAIRGADVLLIAKQTGVEMVEAN